MRKSLIGAGLLAATIATPVMAYQAGDVVVRAGVITVTTNEKSSGVKVDRGPLAGNNLGGKVSKDNDTQLGLNFTVFVHENIGIELLAASPFSTNAKIKGTGAVDGDLGKVTYLPPVLSVVYHPLSNNSKWQPYVGVGINYTWFYQESLSSDMKAGNNAAGFPLSNFRVKNTWNPAYQVGLDYMWDDNLILNAQIRYIDLTTTAYVDVGNDGRAKVDFQVKPVAYMVGIGYKF